ncbi:transglycosylase family protein [Streptomyces sp. NPDC091259]|uniref:transglycosylase family protein n=1 Tax=Streptomyces sp. NPDC091259 TaxID=3365976 RepID=UPI00382D99B6
MPRPASRVRLAASVALASVAGMSGSLLAAAPATAASLATWDKVAQCEATGNWQAIDSTGTYFGGLQFSQSTWQAYGGLSYASRADRATKQQQILIGEKVLKGQGERAWPLCGPSSGLGADDADPYPSPVPPLSKVTGPGAGSVLTGPVTLTASVTDAVGAPTGATFYVDGTAVGTDTGAGPSYAITLDTAGLADGPHTLTVKAVNDAGQTGPASAEVSLFTANRSTTTQASGDFNGDGKADVGVLYDYGQEGGGAYHSALWTYTSNGSGFNAPVKVWDNVASGAGSWNWDRSKVTTGDFNGDGKSDIGVLYNNGQDADGTNHTALWTFTSTGSGFSAPVKKWDSSSSWNWNRSKLTSGDFDGDGKTDVGVFYNNGQQADGTNLSALWTFTSTGSGFNAPVKKWDNDDRTTGSWNWDRSKVVAGDLTGDGKADIGVLYDNGQQSDGKNITALWTLTSTGAGFNAPVKKWDNDDRTTGSWNWDRSKVTVGDYNGDGKADIGVLYDNGQDAGGTNHTALWTMTSTGSGFGGPAKKWDSGSDSWNADASKVTSGDFDGDGKTDVGVLYNYGRQADGTNRTGLWSFTGTATGFNPPAKKWESTSSWNWFRSDLA